MSIIYEVIDKNTTFFGAEEVFVDYSINIPGSGTLTSPISTLSGSYQYENYLNPAFTNESEIKAFLTQFYGNNFVEGVNYTFSGDYVTIKSYLIQTINYKQSSTTSVNWKTGWAQSIEQTIIFTNGSRTELKIEAVNGDFLNSMTNFVFNVAELAPMIIIPVIGLLLTLSYRRYSSTVTDKKKIPFSNFLKKQMTYTRKKSQNKSVPSDRAIEMIEEILNETNNET